MKTVIGPEDEFSVSQTSSGHFIIFYKGTSTVTDTAELAGDEFACLLKTILIDRSRG